MEQHSYTFPIESLLTHEQRVMAPLTQSELAFAAAQIPKTTLCLSTIVNTLNSKKLPSFDYEFSFPVRTEPGRPLMSIAQDKDLSEKGRYSMKIEVPRLYNVTLGDNTVSFDLNHTSLIAGIFHIFHEYRHLQQYVDLKRVEPLSKDAVAIAKVEVIRKLFPGYYLGKNHDHLLVEINAQLYAIKSTMKYAQEHLPGLDAEKLLLEANEAGQLGMHMPGCKSVDELIASWENRKANPERCSLEEATYFPYPISQKASKLLTPQFSMKYDSFKTAEEKDNFVFEEAIKIHPTLKMTYPCLIQPKAFRIALHMQFLKPVSAVRRKIIRGVTIRSERNTFSKYSMKKIYRHRE